MTLLTYPSAIVIPIWHRALLLCSNASLPPTQEQECIFWEREYCLVVYGDIHRSASSNQWPSDGEQCHGHPGDGVKRTKHSSCPMWSQWTRQKTLMSIQLAFNHNNNDERESIDR